MYWVDVLYLLFISLRSPLRLKDIIVFCVEQPIHRGIRGDICIEIALTLVQRIHYFREFLASVTDTIMAMNPGWTGDRIKTIARGTGVHVGFKSNFLGFDRAFLNYGDPSISRE